MHRVLLAIPVYNEAKCLHRVIQDAQSYCDHILVIDDGSSDATPDILRSIRGVRVLTHPENRGYGKSISDAFEWAEARGFDWLITMDADEQHEASHIPRFVHTALSGDADVVSGTRYPTGWDDEGAAPPDRREINRIVTSILNRRLCLGLTDAFCGFKAYRVSALRHIHITVPGYAMPMQFWVQAARAGLHIRELPIRLIYNDPTRHFGGLLDVPSERLAHYLQVLDSEIRSPAPIRCGVPRFISSFRG